MQVLRKKKRKNLAQEVKRPLHLQPLQVYLIVYLYLLFGGGGGDLECKDNYPNIKQVKY